MNRTETQGSCLPILYSFRRCPYAMRARMSILSAGIRCELREVVLREKPAELIALSPKATVPILQLTEGTIIDESLNIMLWALENYDPENWLNPPNSSLTEALELVKKTETQLKPNLDRYKYPDRYTGANKIEHRGKCTKFIGILEEILSEMPYLFGKRACIADIAIFPFIRQFANTDRNWFDKLPYQHTQAWLTKFLNSAHFDIAMKKYTQWHAGNVVMFFPE